ncbi:MAG: RING finger domain-containing protein [Promethearchaeota archaeon]
MNYLNLSKFNYCPNCGKKLLGLNLSKLNYCCFCGTHLKKTEKSTNLKIQCTICHKYVNTNKNNTIECSYCNSLYHSTCIESWLIKYNSCPLCLNVFLMPIKVTNNQRRI